MRNTRTRGTGYVAAGMVAFGLMHGEMDAQQARATKAAATGVGALRASFIAPPPQARLRCYWWWLNGHTDKATITHDLEEMQAKGFGGALLVDANGAEQNGNRNVPPGPTFGSPAWVELYTHALREADRLGLEITLNITSGWNLGGPEVKPEEASKLLTWSRTPVKGGAPATVRLEAPPAKNGFYRPIAVLAYPLHHGAALAVQPGSPAMRTRSAAAETGFSMPDATSMMLDAEMAVPADTSAAEVRDVTARMQPDGTLQYELPAGDWELLRVGYTDSDARVSTASGAWQGLAIDYLSRTAFDSYWKWTVKPLLEAARPFHSLKYLASDSWELGGTNWTESFAAEFRKRRGYDALPWLPVMAGRIVGDRDSSTRFLTDLRRTVADLVADNHYAEFAARAAEYGLGVQAESGGPHGAPIDALETFRHSAVPQTEFWSPNAHRARDDERFFTKEGASAANIYGQRLVAQEGETSIGPQWSESLATDLKPSFDMAVTEGMNRLVWHEFTSSPASTGLPGQEYFAGTHINPKVTWWAASNAFFLYLNRVQAMMQQGTAVNDLLYFYGDNVPSFVRLKADDPAHALPGFDYDVTNEDALLHTLRMGDGRLRGPSGVEWKALVMPKSGRLSMPALQQIERYVKSGGVVIGSAPLSPTGMVDAPTKQAFGATVRAMWGEHCDPSTARAYGAGRIYCTQDAHAAMALMHVAPDVEVSGMEAGAGQAGSKSAFDWVHRRVGAAEIYFLRNATSTVSEHDVTFRVHGGSVEIWDAVTGEMRSAVTSASDSGRTAVPVRLEPFGSAFVVFAGAEGRRSPVAASSARSEPVSVSGPWQVSFQAGRGVRAEPFMVNDLKSWTEWADAGVRYFSGTATYRASVRAPEHAPGEMVLLHFADLHEIARVKVNGHDAGTVWAKPLTLRVDPWLKAGENSIEVEVTNLWPNRIIGDLQPDATERITQTNIQAYRKDSPLLASGLAGGVEWIVQK